jgi:ubiquinone biosynthesis UbiH/UbiF/VisC/COQ6 family hydroxylase
MSAVAADYDVVIAGAGLVGLALAPVLANAGLSVALADRTGVTMPEPPPDGEGWDTRIYAISPGSAAFLRALGAWQALPPDRVAPIEAMRVEGDAGARLDFSAYELGERALAWIVEERALRTALIAVVRSAGVAIHAPCTFESLSLSDAAGVLQLASGGSLTARLIVGADGVRSWVRDAAGITATVKPYGQTAVVANFACERAHRGRAYQWFVEDGGILAWLPLPGRRISMVWSAPEPLAQELLGLPREALAARVAERGRHALGAFECITPGAGFPLQLVKLPNVTARRLALIGDAAHGVHPLAGQGVNLGFGDAEVLAAVLRERGSLADAGAPILLDRYARRRAEPVLAMQTVTDALAHLFGTTTPWIRSVRNIGMAAIDRLPPAKRLLALSALR